VREASSLVTIETLTRCGARVRAYDPVAAPNARRALGDPPQVDFVDSAAAALQDADALAVVTEWREFRSPDFAALAASLKSKVVFDGRNLYDPDEVRAAGLAYVGIGRGGR
jgi:UDPglucose 6-dehydrogenase